MKINKSAWDEGKDHLRQRLAWGEGKKAERKFVATKQPLYFCDVL